MDINVLTPPPALRFVDTSPLAARYALFALAIIAFAKTGAAVKTLNLSRKTLRLMRLFIRAQQHNNCIKRKLDMLASAQWRARVLADLGGLRKLTLWEAAFGRAQIRNTRSAFAPNRLPLDHQPAWCYAPARKAESERLKAHTRDCAKACASPLIFRDQVQLDREGLFRLAAIPRGSYEGARERRIYSAGDIADYNYDAAALAPGVRLRPVSLWPAEFYAAMLAEDERMTDDVSSDYIRIPKISPLKTIAQMPAETLPLQAFMGAKTYAALFETPI